MAAAVAAALCLCLGMHVDAYSKGAPTSSCGNMKPHHVVGAAGLVGPQRGSAPYTLSTELQQDGTVKVVLSGKDAFKGFHIQARQQRDTNVLVPGKFLPNSGAPYSFLECNGQESSAITHKNSDPKSEVVAYWMPPPGFVGTLRFRATVVKDIRTFWVGILSNPIDIASDGSTTSQDPRHELLTDTPSPSMYDKCGTTHGCFGISSSCIGTRTCNVLVTWAANDTGVRYEVVGNVGSSNVWIAAGISETHEMEHASVVDCFLNGNNPEVRESWNEAAYKNRVLDKVTPGVTFLSKRVLGGVLSCSWFRKHRTLTEQRNFDTRSKLYHVMLATGHLDTNTRGKQHHTVRRSSPEKLNMNLNLVSTAASAKDLFIQLHASLMIVAWLLLVSVSILLARYYKKVWEATTICGVKPWFAFHRMLMVLALSMMIAAIVLIFYRIGGWSPTSNPHPILGCVSTGLALIQPFMAIFRCSPHAPNRYIFNWLHWMNGNAAQIIAVVTILFAPALSKAQLEEAVWFVYLVVAFIVFHVLVHIIMQFHSWAMDRKVTSEDIKMNDIRSNGVAPGEEIVEPLRDAPGGGFRRFVLGVYIVLAMLNVAALVATIWLV